MVNDPLSLCSLVGVSIVLVSEVILGCLEALKFSCGNNLSTHSLISSLATSLSWSSLGDGASQAPTSFSLGEHSPGSRQQLWLLTASRASQHRPAVQDMPHTFPSCSSVVTQPFLSISGLSIAFRDKILVIPLPQKSKQARKIKP